MCALANSRKLFTKSHQFLTAPIGGISYFGLSDFAKNYFLNFTKADLDYNPKLKFSINNNDRIVDFLKSSQPKTLSHKLFQQRFLIRQGEPITLLETIEFDVQVMAPVDLRVLSVNPQCWSNWRKILIEDWLFKVQILNEQQLSSLGQQKPSLLDYI